MAFLPESHWPSASRIAGSITSSRGSRPCASCAASSPATVPGTPTARCPRVDDPAASPAYISRQAPDGARSRKSQLVAVPSARRRTRKPPPPTFPASGLTTASANPMPTAASTAFPPWRRIWSPTLLASGCPVATIAWSARAGSSESPVTTASASGCGLVSNAGRAGAGREHTPPTVPNDKARPRKTLWNRWKRTGSIDEGGRAVKLAPWKTADLTSQTSGLRKRGHKGLQSYPPAP